MTAQARSIEQYMLSKTAADFELVTERTAFDALETDWNALFDRAGRSSQVFQTFNWNWHWANHYLSGAPGGIEGLNLSIVTARRDGQLIMVWPLVSERVRGITQIFWMGEPVSQYGDVIIDNLPDALDVMRAGWAFLASHAKGDVVRLRRVRSDAAVAPLMAEIGARITDRQKAPYLDLTSAPSFAKYEERYSGQVRRNRRRLSRRLEEQGPMLFERHKGGAEASLPAAVVAARGPDSTIQGALLNAILRADTTTLPAWTGVDLGNQGYAVARITKVMDRTPVAANIAVQERNQYASVIAKAESDAYFQLLKARYKVQMKVAKPSTLTDLK